VVNLYKRFTETFFRYANRDYESTNYLRSLQKTQWLTRGGISKLQWRRLRALIDYVYCEVPYYHRIFRERGLKPNDIKTKEDLAKLPVLKKDTVRKNFNDLISRDFPTEKLIASSTGGTTGEPLRFYLTREYRKWASAAAWRAYEWCGFELGDRQALIWGSPIDSTKLLKLRGQISCFFLRTLFLDSFSLSDTTMREFAAKLVIQTGSNQRLCIRNLCLC